MNKFILCAALLLSSNIAEAGVVHVATRPIAMGGGAALLVFEFNALGAAWIEERDYNGYSEGGVILRPKFGLPGLRFDPVTAQIMYGPVVCARVVPMAAGYSVYKTGRCRLGTMVADHPPTGVRLEQIVMAVR